MLPLASTRPSSALPLLFAHYVAGKMAQAQWDQFAEAFDENDASAEERAAFACFYLDATTSGTEVDLPKPNELKDMLAAMRV